MNFSKALSCSRVVLFPYDTQQNDVCPVGVSCGLSTEVVCVNFSQDQILLLRWVLLCTSPVAQPSGFRDHSWTGDSMRGIGEGEVVSFPLQKRYQNLNTVKFV